MRVYALYEGEWRLCNSTVGYGDTVYWYRLTSLVWVFVWSVELWKGDVERECVCVCKYLVCVVSMWFSKLKRFYIEKDGKLIKIKVKQALTCRTSAIWHLIQWSPSLRSPGKKRIMTLGEGWTSGKLNLLLRVVGAVKCRVAWTRFHFNLRTKRVSNQQGRVLVHLGSFLGAWVSILFSIDWLVTWQP